MKKTILALTLASAFIAGTANAASHDQAAQKTIAEPFSQMNEHEQAAVAHSFSKNGQAFAHESQMANHMKQATKQ
ncbi:hypothetical protein [Yokenella regensburgei]|uniref:hypothetical protein n=1 Tax=Yokenella regensburgei TaxID=158877 RepID=UPI003EDA3F55